MSTIAALIIIGLEGASLYPLARLIARFESHERGQR